MIPSICSLIYSCCILKLKLYSTGSVCTLVEFWGLTRQIRKKSNTNGSSIDTSYNRTQQYLSLDNPCFLQGRVLKEQVLSNPVCTEGFLFNFQVSSSNPDNPDVIIRFTFQTLESSLQDHRAHYNSFHKLGRAAWNEASFVKIKY